MNNFYRTQLEIFKDVQERDNLDKLNEFLKLHNVLQMYTDVHNGSAMAFVIYTHDEIRPMNSEPIKYAEYEEVQENKE